MATGLMVIKGILSQFLDGKSSKILIKNGQILQRINIKNASILATISINNYTRTKISSVSGVDNCTVTFTSNINLQAWEARAGGSGVGQGLLVGSGTTLVANTDQSFVVDDSELTNGDGAYQINIYGQNLDGDWSTYG